MIELSNCAFRKTYTLLAQTPMIHFQHDQSGATLRPSEVKPKLDRYLRSLRATVPARWLVSGQPQALNYQMRIVALGDAEQAKGLTIQDCKAYFGNMGNGPAKGLVFRNCRLEINCFIPDLLKFLDENIGSFFVLHNFGTRQSKGFGSFLVEGMTPAAIRQTIEAQCPHFFYTTLRGTPDVRIMLDHALAVYTVLKNGTNQTRHRNYPNRYIKGYAVRKFLPEKVGSDKAFMKSHVVPSEGGHRVEAPEVYPSHVFIRALLGMADHYEFRDDMRNGGLNPRGKLRPKVVNVVNFDGAEIEGNHVKIPPQSIKDGLGIKRFRSPLLIKVCGNRIFFILDDSWKLMLDKVFLMMQDKDFKAADRAVKEKRYADAQTAFQRAHYICTPADFDPDAFITGFLDYFNQNRSTMQQFPDRGAGSELYWASALVLEKGGRN